VIELDFVLRCAYAPLRCARVFAVSKQCQVCSIDKYFSYFVYLIYKYYKIWEV